MKKLIKNLFIILVVVAMIIPTIPVMAADNINGTYVLYSGVGNNMVLDIQGASKNIRANAQIYSANGTKAQQFKIEPYGKYYRIINVNSNMAVDVKGASKSNRANVQQYSWNKTNAQLWKFVSAGNGYYYIINVGSDMALDVQGAKNTSRTNVQQYCLNKTAAQKWKLVKLGGGTKKTNTQTSTKTSTQKTTTTKTNTSTKSTAPKDTVANIKNGVYYIRSKVHSAFVLDVKGAAKGNSANVQLYTYSGDANQKWKFEKIGNGVYKITNVNSGKMLDAKGGKAANNTNVQQFTWNNTNSQKWYAIKNADGSYTFKSAINQNFVLDLSGAKAEKSRNIQLYTRNNSTAQKWNLTEVTQPITATPNNDTVYTPQSTTTKPATTKPVHTHSYSSWKSDNTNHWKECSCGNKSSTAKHTWDAGKVTKAATETATGIKTYTCTVCKKAKTETIPKKVHTHSYTVIKNATCTTEGTKKCSCGNTMPIPKTSHKESNWYLEEVNGKQTGKQLKKCTVCGTELRREDAKAEYMYISSSPQIYFMEYTDGDIADIEERMMYGLPVYGKTYTEEEIDDYFNNKKTIFSGEHGDFHYDGDFEGYTDTYIFTHNVYPFYHKIYYIHRGGSFDEYRAISTRIIEVYRNNGLLSSSFAPINIEPLHDGWFVKQGLANKTEYYEATGVYEIDYTK